MQHDTIQSGTLVLLVMSILLVRPGWAQSLLERHERHVTEFSLDNGLRFIVYKNSPLRNQTTTSFFTFANVGNVNDPNGHTGMTHMIRRMAFKGTTTIGTENSTEEWRAMQRVDSIQALLQDERLQRPYSERLRELKAEFETVKEEAGQFVVSNDFKKRVAREGGQNLGVDADADATYYLCKFPVHKQEAWFMLESERLLNPVLREFYIERDTAITERKTLVDDEPIERLSEHLLAAAFQAHPYRQPYHGHPSDLQTLSRNDATAFFDKYYGASNLIISIVGNIDTEQIRLLATQYFGQLPVKEKPRPIVTVEPVQNGERSTKIIVEELSRQYLQIGYNKGSLQHEDDVTFEVLTRVVKKMLEGTGVASEVSATNGIPGDKYPNLFVIQVQLKPGRTLEETQIVIDNVLTRIKNGDVTTDDMNRAKRQARKELTQQLQDDRRMARLLAFYQVAAEDWRELFRRHEKIGAVTPEIIQEVAQQTFTPQNRTVATTER